MPGADAVSITKPYLRWFGKPCSTGGTGSQRQITTKRPRGSSRPRSMGGRLSWLMVMKKCLEAHVLGCLSVTEERQLIFHIHPGHMWMLLLQCLWCVCDYSVKTKEQTQPLEELLEEYTFAIVQLTWNTFELPLSEQFNELRAFCRLSHELLRCRGCLHVSQSAVALNWT